MEQYYLNSLRGQLDSYQQYYFLPHEHIFHNLSALHGKEQNLSISLSTINQIRANPFCSMDNLKLNEINEMAHELQQFPGKLIILESTNQENGLDMEKLHKLQLLIDVVILVGFSIPSIQPNTPQSTLQILHSKENITKRLDLEIKIGANNVRPAFLGEITLSTINLQDEITLNYLEIFFMFSNTCSIPILFEVDQDINNFAKLELIYQRYIKDFPKAVVVITNYPILFQTSYNQNSKSILITNTEDIHHSMQKIPAYFVFDLHTYEYPDLVAELIAQNQESMMFASDGVRFKSHLKTYGGTGYGLNINQREVLFQKNQQLLKIFNWALRVVKVVEILQWQCMNCNQMFNEDLEKFKKFEMVFCSIKCLKQGVANKK